MYAVIMAGGRGTRFWPKSREKLPKHLQDILGKRTLIQETVDRIGPLIPVKNILIVTGANHSDVIKQQLPNLPEENIIVEPVGRNTAPCIGLAAMHIKKKNPEGVMFVLPSDHYIGDEEAFRRTIAIAGEMAQRGNHLLTIGIKPTDPETGYGYMEQGEAAAAIRGEEIFQVKSFREKPDIEQAKTFLENGGFLWNSGMFVWKVSTILNKIEKLLPDLYKSLKEIEDALGTDSEKNIISKAYKEITPISIDNGIMESSGKTLLVRGDFGWSDIGSWSALWEMWDKDENGNAVKGRFVGIDSSNSLIYSPDKLVALVGVEDLVVVETADSILVCKKKASQDVKKLVEMLEEKNMKEYL
jgi:mannose-1-phosphate guanylyltransferase